MLFRFALTAAVYLSSLVMVLIGIGSFLNGDASGFFPALNVLTSGTVAAGSAYHLLDEFDDIFG